MQGAQKKGGRVPSPTFLRCGHALDAVSSVPVVLNHFIYIHWAIVDATMHLLHASQKIAVIKGDDILLATVSFHSVVQ